MKNFVLTRGNGAQHAIAIISHGRGLDLEDLATGFANLNAPSITVFARLATIFLRILRIVLLITSSLITKSAWFLLAAGGLGMLQDMFVARRKRSPEALGVPLNFLGVGARPHSLLLHTTELMQPALLRFQYLDLRSALRKPASSQHESSSQYPQQSSQITVPSIPEPSPEWQRKHDSQHPFQWRLSNCQSHSPGPRIPELCRYHRYRKCRHLGCFE
jgi:hypothetical protein